MLRRNAKDANGRARARRKEGKRSSGAKKSNMSAEIYLFNPGTHSGLASWKIKRERERERQLQKINSAPWGSFFAAFGAKCKHSKCVEKLYGLSEMRKET